MMSVRVRDKFGPPFSVMLTPPVGTVALRVRDVLCACLFWRSLSTLFREAWRGVHLKHLKVSSSYAEEIEYVSVMAGGYKHDVHRRSNPLVGHIPY